MINSAYMANLGFLLLLVPVDFFKNKYLKLFILCLCIWILACIKCYNSMSIVQISRGVVGDLSVSGLMFFIAIILRRVSSLRFDPLPKIFCLLIATIGLVLYLSALDIIPFDLYALGYNPQTLLYFIFCFAILLLFINVFASIVLLLALLCFIFKLQSSVNLWDYLIDPIFWLMCILSLCLNFNLKNFKASNNHANNSLHG